jgi:hypothetical protein
MMTAGSDEAGCGDDCVLGRFTTRPQISIISAGPAGDPRSGRRSHHLLPDTLISILLLTSFLSATQPKISCLFRRRSATPDPSKRYSSAPSTRWPVARRPHRAPDVCYMDNASFRTEMKIKKTWKRLESTPSLGIALTWSRSL